MKFWDGNCEYCGTKEKLGVDRIDNTKGYIKGNCVTCCKWCNMMKKNLSVEDFIKHITKIYDWSNENGGSNIRST